jgi:hypothetical protein
MNELSCGSPTLPMGRGFSPTIPTGGCGCGGGCSGGCNGFVDTAPRQNAPCCGNGQEVTEHIVIVDQPDCPEGYVPQIVLSAKQNPRFSGLFGCMKDCDLQSFLCCYEKYRTPGCGDNSVLLAAAHFLTLQMSGQILTQTTFRTQAKNGKPLKAFDLSGNAVNKNNEHWYLTAYGLEYFQMFERPAIAVAAMAWGV